MAGEYFVQIMSDFRGVKMNSNYKKPGLEIDFQTWLVKQTTAFLLSRQSCTLR